MIWAASFICLAFATLAEASAIPLGTWEEFGFTIAGTPATGCAPNDPDGNFCISSSGTFTDFLGAPPWTFDAPAGTSLTVTDAFTAGDEFEVFDFGSFIGFTSDPFGDTDCGDDPVPCLSTPGISSRTFNLPAGLHSITITASLSGGGGAGFLLAQAVPEPSSLIPAGAILAGLWFAKRRVRALSRR